MNKDRIFYAFAYFLSKSLGLSVHECLEEFTQLELQGLFRDSFFYTDY